MSKGKRQEDFDIIQEDMFSFAVNATLSYMRTLQLVEASDNDL